MPRGRNPNSLKNLIPGGGAPKFKKGEKRSKESIEKQKQTIKEQKIINIILFIFGLFVIALFVMTG